MGQVKQFSNRSGSPGICCHVVVFDETNIGFTITLWDAELIQLAQKWKTKYDGKTFKLMYRVFFHFPPSLTRRNNQKKYRISKSKGTFDIDIKCAIW